ncbi:MAG: AraC family transcriptional regulator [Lachnospiraceae bacterium]|nr:AraC family transcriptional regulator [Lachnospiraceae bacterium]
MIIIRGCGHDSHHKKPCNIKYHEIPSDYLFLLIKKTAWVYLDGSKEVLPENSCICFPPGSTIHYGCDTPDYNDDWIHVLFTEESAHLLEELQIPLYRPMVPRNLHKLSDHVRLMSDIYLTGASYKEQILDHMAQAFLYTLSEELQASVEDDPTQKYYASFSSLRTGIYNNPSIRHSVAELAESMWLSISHFQHLYKQFFGCSCQQDMINARLTQAKYYLTQSEMSIRAISAVCGYENELHFMRQFKKFEGVTPSEYRKQTN